MLSPKGSNPSKPPQRVLLHLFCASCTSPDRQEHRTLCDEQGANCDSEVGEDYHQKSWSDGRAAGFRLKTKTTQVRAHIVDMSKEGKTHAYIRERLREVRERTAYPQSNIAHTHSSPTSARRRSWTHTGHHEHAQGLERALCQAGRRQRPWRSSGDQRSELISNYSSNVKRSCSRQQQVANLHQSRRARQGTQHQASRKCRVPTPAGPVCERRRTAGGTRLTPTPSSVCTLWQGHAFLERSDVSTAVCARLKWEVSLAVPRPRSTQQAD